MKKIVAFLFIFAAFSQLGWSASREIVIAKARIESVRDLPDPPRPANWVGGRYEVRAAIQKVLFGKLRASHIALTMDISNTPLTPVEVFLLLERGPGAHYQVVVWDYFESGLCIRQDIARDYQIETTVRDLKAKYPCSALGG
jgi:hypothetical protein